MSSSSRRWNRVRFDGRVHMRSSAQDAEIAVRSYELSEGGMSLFVLDTLEIGSGAHLRFTLPGGGAELQLAAVVRNQRGFRCGLEFTALGDPERERLRQYLQSPAAGSRP
jgi:hypothetical protein